MDVLEREREREKERDSVWIHWDNFTDALNHTSSITVPRAVSAVATSGVRICWDLKPPL